MTLVGFTTGGRRCLSGGSIRKCFVCTKWLECSGWRCEMDLCSAGAYALRKERDVDGETGVNIYRGDS